MAEYIEKGQLVKDLLLLADVETGIRQQAILGCASTIQNRKAADVAPVRHGRWDGGYTKTSDGEWVYSTPKCTVCGSKSNGGTTNFCPYCGCKMLEDSDGKK